MGPNPGQTVIVRGTFSDECTTENDLMKNQNLFPEVKRMMYQVDKRQLSTFLTSGAVGPYGINATTDSKFGKAPEGSPIGSNNLQFSVMGRLDQPSTILQQIGASGSDGSFSLLIRDKYIYKGHNVQFANAGRYQALCMGEPTKTAGGYIYNFQHKQGQVFVYATHAAPNSNGQATCMAVSTNYGEGSNRSYSRTMSPDRFIVDMTIQRKTVSITGDAANDITWYDYMGQNGLTRAGWKYTAVRQGEALFAGENEYEKWFGLSSMKDENGARRAVSPYMDPDGEGVITAGDGVEEQISGGNELYGSGVDGNATADDFIDLQKLLVKKSNSTDSKVNLIFVTGLDGFYNFQTQAGTIAASLGGQIFVNVTAGDNKVTAGYTFTTINYGGSTITCVVHPMFDDAVKFPATGIDGKNIMSGTYFGGNLEGSTGPNMEIIAKGGNGGNRSMVTADLKGMTGIGSGSAITQKDADTFAMLRQDLIVIYNTQNWAVIRKS